SGSFTFTASATDSNQCSGNRSYTIIICQNLTVNPAVLPNAVVNVNYNQTVTATGGTSPYTFAITAGALPPGMTLAPAGGITGPPNPGGAFPSTIPATDTNGCTGSRDYTVRVCPQFTILPTSLPHGTRTVPYGPITITASGGTAPYTFTVTSGTFP